MIPLDKTENVKINLIFLKSLVFGKKKITFISYKNKYKHWRRGTCLQCKVK